MTVKTTTTFSMEQPVLGVTMGDVAGIGPEIIVKALQDPEIRRAAKYIVFGMHEQMSLVADRLEVEPFWRRVQHEKIGRDNPSKVMLADYDDFSVPPRITGSSRIGGGVLSPVLPGRDLCCEAGDYRRHRHRSHQQNQLDHGKDQVARPYGTLRRKMQVAPQGDDDRESPFEAGVGRHPRGTV